MLDKVRRAERERVKRDLHRISHAARRTAARAAARRFVTPWRDRYPAVTPFQRRFTRRGPRPARGQRLLNRAVRIQ